MTAKHQIHSKFKLFSGSLGAGASLGALATEVETFAKSRNTAAKSIGIEYLEHEKQVVVSLGYRDDEPGYPIKLHSVSLGTVKTFKGEELARLEKKMGEAADKIAGIICHELFVTDTHEFVMVFMSHAG